MTSFKNILIALVFMFGIHAFSQTAAEIKYDKERFERKNKELKAQLINDIIEELNVDAFERQIISQSIESYFEELTKIYMYDISGFEKQDLVTQLDKRHFNDLKTILDQDQIDYILNQLKGDWKEEQKKKKKKKKKPKKNN